MKCETFVPLNLRRRQSQLVNTAQPARDPGLLASIGRARYWQQLPDAGVVVSAAELAERESLTPPSVWHVLRLACLAPDLVEWCLAGQQPRTLTQRWLERHRLPDDWRAQRDLIDRFDEGGCEMPRKGHGRITWRPVTQEIPQPAGSIQMETFVPWTLVTRGARKQIVTLTEALEAFRMQAAQSRDAEIETPALRSPGLAYYSQHLLNTGQTASLREIAAAEDMDLGQVSRIARLAWLGAGRWWRRRSAPVRHWRGCPVMPA